MKITFLAALGAAALLLASCSEDQKTETTAATPAPTATPAGSLITTDASPIPTVYPSAADTIAFRDDARHLAGRVATDLRLTDKATARRLENTYFVRRQRLAGLNARYAADTAGRSAALRQLNEATDREVRQVLPTPELMRTYESSRADYYDGPATADAAAAEVETEATETIRPAPAPAAKARSASGRRGPRIVKYKKSGREVKIKYSNGMTLKIDEDGRRKVKYSLGAKAKAALSGQRRKAKK